jgi:hypothetical protein
MFNLLPECMSSCIIKKDRRAILAAFTHTTQPARTQL